MAMIATTQTLIFKTSSELERLKYLLEWKNVEQIVSNVWYDLTKLSYNIYQKDHNRFELNRTIEEHHLVLEYGGTVVFFEVEHIVELKEIERRLEASFDKAGHLVRRSPVIHNIVWKWLENGRRKEVMELADRTIKISPRGENDVVRGMRLAAEICGAATFPKCFIDDAGQTLFVFVADTEEEVLKKFENLTPKKSVKTSIKVLAKMVLSRMEKLNEAVINYNDWVTNHNEISRNMNTNEIMTHIKLEEISSVQKTFDFLKSIEKISHIIFYEKVYNFKNVMKKDGVTDEVMSEAWNMFLVKQVMTKLYYRYLLILCQILHFRIWHKMYLKIQNFFYFIRWYFLIFIQKWRYVLNNILNFPIIKILEDSVPFLFFTIFYLYKYWSHPTKFKQKILHTTTFFKID